MIIVEKKISYNILAPLINVHLGTHMITGLSNTYAIYVSAPVKFYLYDDDLMCFFIT